MRHAAELPEKRGAAYRVGCGAASGRAWSAYLAGQRAGRRGHGAVPAGAGGVLAFCHAGHGGRLGGSYPAHGRRTQRPGHCPRCGPGNAAASAGGGASAGAVCRRAAAGNSGSCGPVVAWRCPRCRSVARFSAGNAMDGSVCGPAGIFHCPAACVAQRVQPAGGADGAHRAGGAGAHPYRRAGSRAALYAGAGFHSGQRSCLSGADAAVLPAGGRPLLCRDKSGAPGAACPPPVGDPVAGGGRPGAFQRPAHGGKYAGARLPCSVSGGCRRAQRRAGAVRRAEGHGSAAAHLSVRAAGEPFGASDAGDHAGPYSGPDGTPERSSGPDAAAHRLFFCIGGDAVLGVGTPAGAAFIPQR